MSKLDKFINSTQSHIVKNWKFYIALFVVLIIWANRKNLFKGLGFGGKNSLDMTDARTRATSSVSELNIRTADNTGNIINRSITVNQSEQDLAKRVNSYFSTVQFFDSERCKICTELMSKTDDELLIIDQLHKQAFHISIFTVLDGIIFDPCASYLDKAIFGKNSDYENIKTRLLNITKNIY